MGQTIFKKHNKKQNRLRLRGIPGECEWHLGFCGTCYESGRINNWHWNIICDLVCESWDMICDLVRESCDMICDLALESWDIRCDFVYGS